MTNTAAQTIPVQSAWLGRLRFALATAVAWAGLHYVASAYVLPHGLDRATVLVGSHHGPLAGLLVVVLLWIAAATTTLIVGAHGPRQTLAILGLALALWACAGGHKGGTIDSWLLLQQDQPGPAGAAPYWMLLGDYAYLLLGVGGAYLIARWLHYRRDADAPLGSRGTDGGTVPPTERSANASSKPGAGVTALLTTTAVAGVLMYILTGSPVAATLRGQVYFAVGLGFIAGVYVARRVVPVRDPLWYWPAPLLLGVIGVVGAALSPAMRLPAEYGGINCIPAWGAGTRPANRNDQGRAPGDVLDAGPWSTTQRRRWPALGLAGAEACRTCGTAR